MKEMRSDRDRIGREKALRSYRVKSYRTGSAAYRAKAYGVKSLIYRIILYLLGALAVFLAGYFGFFSSDSNDDCVSVLGKAVFPEHYELERGRVIYTGFDELGRTGPVYAHLDASNLLYGDRERGEINAITPSGWYANQKVEVYFSDGRVYRGWFYNRSHLLAHALGGEDEAYNLITGTRAQNVGSHDGRGGMQYAENSAIRYLESGGGSIYYFVTPVYEGEELVARCVLIDMRSDDGSIDERVRVDNRMPGFEIDYMTGEYRKK